MSSVTCAVWPATALTLPTRPSAVTTGSLTRIPLLEPAAIPTCCWNSLGDRDMTSVET